MPETPQVPEHVAAYAWAMGQEPVLRWVSYDYETGAPDRFSTTHPVWADRHDGPEWCVASPVEERASYGVRAEEWGYVPVPSLESPEWLAAVLDGVLEKEIDVLFRKGHYDIWGECDLTQGGFSAIVAPNSADPDVDGHGPTPAAALCAAVLAAKEHAGA